MTQLICRHCHNPGNKVVRPRGLCWKCYYTPGVRDVILSTSKYSPRSARGQAIPTNPADAPPPPATALSREERIAAYTARASANLPLFEDCREPQVDPPVCCMGCGAVPPQQRALQQFGWQVRPAPHTYNGVSDCVCPACFESHGWWYDDVPLIYLGDRN